MKITLFPFAFCFPSAMFDHSPDSDDPQNFWKWKLPFRNTFFFTFNVLVLEPINVLTLQLENNSIDIQNYWGMTKINVFTCMCCYTSLVSDYCNPNVSMFSVFFNQLSQIKVMHIKIEKKVNVSPFRPFHHN